MRKLTFLLTFFMLLGSVQLQAKEYAIKDIPMVHLQNRTRYVSNPDSILSSTAVTTMDSILYALEQKTGIQTLVVAVTGIEGGDCFDFAHRLGQETGVGQKERDNGLVILLSTDERCVQFATGYGLEGILPDAICKRIQNRYMLPYFKDNNWNAGMVAGIRAVNGYLDGSMENIGNIIRKTKCFDFWERNVLFPKTKRSFFRTPKHPLPCPFPLNFSLLIITKKFGNLAKNRYICIV